MLVVDEAHHLGWSPESVSAEYALVEVLGRESPGLLLLTAHLSNSAWPVISPGCDCSIQIVFFDLGEFLGEAEGYRDVAGLAEKLQSGQSFKAGEAAVLARILGDGEVAVRAKLEQIGERAVRGELMNALLDQHGTGRVMFRNTRATIAGFPRRMTRLSPLDEDPENVELFEALAGEFAADTAATAAQNFEPDFSADPRIDWLIDLLREAWS